MTKLQNLENLVGKYFPGFVISVIVAITAQFLSDHYNAPAMLMALLLGIALHFLSEEGRAVEGIAFSSKTILRFGVALLGARVSIGLLAELGATYILLVMFGVIFTIIFGMLLARFTSISWSFAFLTAGSVAICGASAAMAIAAILPKDNQSERNLIFTVLGVTILSTVAMITYPIFLGWLEFTPQQSGIFIGGTIHDVAQVVGAGFSVSNETGEVATLVKLFRVTMLAPIVLIASLYMRSQNQKSDQGGAPPIMPGFVIVFLILAGINSLGLIPPELLGFINQISRWALLTSIAAVGMKTSIKRMLSVGENAIGLIVAETLFIGGFILFGLYALG